MVFSSCYLSVGSRGKFVEISQKALNRRQYHPEQEILVIDGYFGPQTKAAVKMFQRDNGRLPTGRLSFDCLEVLVRPFDLDLSDPLEDLPPDARSSLVRSEPPSVVTTWITSVFRSAVGQLGLLSFLGFFLLFGAFYIIEKEYGAELLIPKVINLILSPPSAPPSDSTSEIEVNGKL